MSLKSEVCFHQHSCRAWSYLTMFIIIWNTASGKHDLADLESNSAPIYSNSATYIFRVRVNRKIHVDIQCRGAKDTEVTWNDLLTCGGRLLKRAFQFRTYSSWTTTATNLSPGLFPLEKLKGFLKSYFYWESEESPLDCRNRFRKYLSRGLKNDKAVLRDRWFWRGKKNPSIVTTELKIAIIICVKR